MNMACHYVAEYVQKRPHIHTCSNLALLGKKKRDPNRYTVRVRLRFRVARTFFHTFSSRMRESKRARERELFYIAFLIHTISMDRTIWICFSFFSHISFISFPSSSCLLVISVNSVRSLMKLHNYTIIWRVFFLVFLSFFLFSIIRT